MINSIDDYALLNIFTFLENYEYQLREVSKTFYNVSKNIKNIKQPHILYLTNSIKMIKWANTLPDFCYPSDALRFAVIHGDLKVVKFLIKDNCSFFPGVYYDAAKHGHFKIIKWLYKKKGKRSNSRAMLGACEYGNKKIVEWMVENDFEIDDNCCNTASRSGNLELLKFLILKHNFKWDHYCFVHAAVKGHIHILKFLYDLSKNDLSMPFWSVYPCIAAAVNGQIKTLKFLRKYNCPWDATVTKAALKHGKKKTFDWLVKNGCPVHENI